MRRRFVRFLWRDPLLVITGVVALLFYSYSWLVQPNRPELLAVFDDPPPLHTVLSSGMTEADRTSALGQYQVKRYGWLGEWSDQFQYGRMARALGHFRLPGLHWDPINNVPTADAPAGEEPSSFSYGLGYPLVGAVFFVLGFRGDPYVVPDGLLFALSAMLALIVARRVMGQRAAFITINVLVLTAPFVLYFVIPYSTTLTAVGVLAVLVVVTGDRFDWWSGGLLALAMSLAFAARYTDVVWMGLVLVLGLALRWRTAWRVFVAVGIGLAATAVVVGVAQYEVFGSAVTTPYHFGAASWSAYEPGLIPSSAVGVFVTGNRHILYRVEPILRSFAWMALAPFGLLVLFRRRHRLRWPMACAALVGAASTLSYLAWIYGTTRDLMIWNIRFHLPWFALWAILSAVAVEALLDYVGAMRTTRLAR